MFSATTKEAANTTINEAKNTAYDAKTAAYSAKRDLRDAADDAKGDLVHIAARAGRQVRHFVDDASEQFTDASEKLTGEIRNNPVRSSAIALGIGVLLGALIRR